MNIEQEREKLILFTKIGAIVLTSFALLATSFFVYPENRAVFNESLLHEKELPIYCVEKEKPQISISFDAAWGNDDTASLLATLKKHKVKATFFMTGGWIEKYPDDVKKQLPPADMTLETTVKTTNRCHSYRPHNAKKKL